MAYLLKMATVMGPALWINEETGFSMALVWVFACWMVLLSTSQRVGVRR